MKSQISIARELITDQLRCYEECLEFNRKEMNDREAERDRAAVQATKACLKCLEDAVILSQQRELF